MRALRFTPDAEAQRDVFEQRAIAAPKTWGQALATVEKRLLQLQTYPYSGPAVAESERQLRNVADWHVRAVYFETPEAIEVVAFQDCRADPAVLRRLG